MTTLIGKFIEGISLNQLEYLLEDDGKVKEFDSKESAKKFLSNVLTDFSEDDLEDNFVYVEKETGERN